MSPHRKPNTLSLLAQNLRRKADGWRDGSEDPEHQHRIGLAPGRGWGRRNLEFMHKVLIPQALKATRGQERLLDDAEIPAGRARVVWVGHASFLVQSAGMNILIDPNWATWLGGVVKRAHRPGLTLQALPRIDAVLISHAHHDHLNIKTLRAISDGQPIFVPKGVGQLVSKCGFGEVVEMSRWDTVRLNGLEISFTPARHWGARYVHDVHRGFGGFLLRQPDIEGSTTIYHAGDSAYFDGFHEIGKRHVIDVALMPIGAYRPVSGRGVHMNPEEALAAFRDVGAKKMVPMHYGTFPLTREPLEEPLQRLLLASSASGLRNRISVLEPGETALF